MGFSRVRRTPTLVQVRLFLESKPGEQLLQAHGLRRSLSPVQRIDEKANDVLSIHLHEKGRGGVRKPVGELFVDEQGKLVANHFSTREVTTLTRFAESVGRNLGIEAKQVGFESPQQGRRVVAAEPTTTALRNFLNSPHGKALLAKHGLRRTRGYFARGSETGVQATLVTLHEKRLRGAFRPAGELWVLNGVLKVNPTGNSNLKLQTFANTIAPLISAKRVEVEKI